MMMQGILDGLHSISRDLTHAARSLAKDRGFTLVCVISLGIGMGGLVALATFTRMITAPARGIDRSGVIELLVLPLGPLRAKAGEWALEQWSYPDYQALRDADIGMAITAWTRESSQTGAQTPDEAAPPRVATRTRELAVRMALGATRLRVFGLMLSDVVKLVIPGVAGGLILAAVLIRTMEDVMGTPLTLGPTPLGVNGAGDLCGRVRDRRLRRTSGRPSGRPPRDLRPADGGDMVRVGMVKIDS